MKKLTTILCIATLYLLSFSPRFCIDCDKFMPPKETTVTQKLQESKDFTKKK